MKPTAQERRRPLWLHFSKDLDGGYGKRTSLPANPVRVHYRVSQRSSYPKVGPRDGIHINKGSPPSYNVRHKIIHEGARNKPMSKKGLLDLDYSKYDFKDPESYIFKSEKGLSRRTVEDISERKAEPEWMKKFRIRSYEHFMKSSRSISGLSFLQRITSSPR